MKVLRGENFEGGHLKLCVCMSRNWGNREDGSGVTGSDPAEWEETKNGLLLSPPGKI